MSYLDRLEGVSRRNLGQQVQALQSAATEDVVHLAPELSVLNSQKAAIDRYFAEHQGSITRNHVELSRAFAAGDHKQAQKLIDSMGAEIGYVAHLPPVGAKAPKDTTFAEWARKPFPNRSAGKAIAATLQAAPKGAPFAPDSADVLKRADEALVQAKRRIAYTGQYLDAPELKDFLLLRAQDKRNAAVTKVDNDVAAIVDGLEADVGKAKRSIAVREQGNFDLLTKDAKALNRVMTDLDQGLARRKSGKIIGALQSGAAAALSAPAMRNLLTVASDGGKPALQKLAEIDLQRGPETSQFTAKALAAITNPAERLIAGETIVRRAKDPAVSAYVTKTLTEETGAFLPRSNGELIRFDDALNLRYDARSERLSWYELGGRDGAVSRERSMKAGEAEAIMRLAAQQPGFVDDGNGGLLNTNMIIRATYDAERKRLEYRTPGGRYGARENSLTVEPGKADALLARIREAAPMVSIGPQDMVSEGMVQAAHYDRAKGTLTITAPGGSDGYNIRKQIEPAAAEQALAQLGGKEQNIRVTPDLVIGAGDLQNLSFTAATEERPARLDWRIRGGRYGYVRQSINNITEETGKAALASVAAQPGFFATEKSGVINLNGVKQAELRTGREGNGLYMDLRFGGGESGRGEHSFTTSKEEAGQILSAMGALPGRVVIADKVAIDANALTSISRTSTNGLEWKFSGGKDGYASGYAYDVGEQAAAKTMAAVAGQEGMLQVGDSANLVRTSRIVKLYAKDTYGSISASGGKDGYFSLSLRDVSGADYAKFAKALAEKPGFVQAGPDYVLNAGAMRTVSVYSGYMKWQIPGGRDGLTSQEVKLPEAEAKAVQAKIAAIGKDEDALVSCQFDPSVLKDGSFSRYRSPFSSSFSSSYGGSTFLGLPTAIGIAVAAGVFFEQQPTDPKAPGAVAYRAALADDRSHRIEPRFQSLMTEQNTALVDWLNSDRAALAARKNWDALDGKAKVAALQRISDKQAEITGIAPPKLVAVDEAPRDGLIMNGRAEPEAGQTIVNTNAASSLARFSDALRTLGHENNHHWVSAMKAEMKAGQISATDPRFRVVQRLDQKPARAASEGFAAYLDNPVERLARQSASDLVRQLEGRDLQLPAPAPAPAPELRRRAVPAA